MSLNPRDREVAEKFKACLRARHVQVKRLVVFGSRARGDHDSDSDLDVLVEVETSNAEVLRAVYDSAWEADHDTPVLLAPTVFSSRDIREGPERASAFIKNVEREGVVV